MLSGRANGEPQESVPIVNPSPLHLFAGFGIELEYMMVAAETLSVLPVADRVLAAAAGKITGDVELGPIAWSNELVNHVIELKTNGPVASLTGVEELFADSVRRVNCLLEPLGGRLLPTAMHPWMDPAAETQLWPHEYNEVYQTFDRIFGCRGHGWSNLQSTHLNLPFHDDAEFARLHAAIRLLLPVLPALAASSPFIEGRYANNLDQRLHVYRGNCARVPLVTGHVIPEPAFSEADYRRRILEPMFAAIAPLDPEGTVRHEWLNARGAIARFMRNTIEIRVLDIQECPQADLSICRAIVAVLQALVNEHWSSLAEQQAWPVEPLEQILLATIRAADQAVIDNADYLALFGLSGVRSCSAAELWRHLLATLPNTSANQAVVAEPALRLILEEGPLARRILTALDHAETPARAALAAVYRRLADCLAEGRLLAARP
ncbi:MAG: glutamate-cysteine ligase family protein [Gemmataceae bacterium]